MTRLRTEMKGLPPSAPHICPCRAEPAVAPRVRARGVQRALTGVVVASAGIDVPAARLFQEEARAEGERLGIEYATTADVLRAAQ